jgi:hypothetical protein
MKCKKLRKERIGIRLTPAEKNQLQGIVKSSEYSSTSQIFRAMVFNETNFSFDKKTPVIRKKIFIQQDPALTASVAKIGNNINQLTRHVNAISKSGERFAAVELYEILNHIDSKLDSIIKYKLDDK